MLKDKIMKKYVKGLSSKMLEILIKKCTWAIEEEIKKDVLNTGTMYELISDLDAMKKELVSRETLNK